MATQSKLEEAAIQADNYERQDGLGRLKPADCVISFESVNKSYLRNASRSLLRHRLTAWITRVPADRFPALKEVSFELPQRGKPGGRWAQRGRKEHSAAACYRRLGSRFRAGSGAWNDGGGVGTRCRLSSRSDGSRKIWS